MGTPFNQLAPHVQAMVLAKLNEGKPVGVARAVEVGKVAFEVAPGKKRIRQRAGDGMNNWEREYKAQLDIQWSYIYREVSLPLANGLRYKLDFLVVSTAPWSILPNWKPPVIEGHEVKGQARSTGIAKVKMAARLYPWIAFRLVTKRKKRDGGGWDIQDVLP